MGNELRERRFTQAELEELWAKFSSGAAALCPFDGFGLALSVDGGSKSYRLVCSHCGVASPWFMSSSDGIVLRAMDPREMGAADDDDRD
jgi:hypothetical protein